jgi:glycosyltransferase involved in cell wall biosynthesis
MFFPSHYEGFGMASTEAMACGCAVVTTPTGFGSDLSDGLDSFVRDFSDEAGMRENILVLLRNDSLRIAMAEMGRRRVHGLTWESQGRKLAQTYLRWLSQWDARLGTGMPQNDPN